MSEPSIISEIECTSLSSNKTTVFDLGSIFKVNTRHLEDRLVALNNSFEIPANTEPSEVFLMMMNHLDIPSMRPNPKQIQGPKQKQSPQKMLVPMLLQKLTGI